MPYDPSNQAASGSSSDAFPGSGQELATQNVASHTSAKLAAIPIILKRGIDTDNLDRRGPLDAQARAMASTASTPTVVHYAEALDAFLNADEKTVEGFQARMYALGPGAFYAKAYYSKSNRPQIYVGVADAGTQQAYEKLLREAAKKEMTVDEVIAEYEKKADPKAPKFNLDDQSSPSATRAPFSPVLTNPGDLKEILRKGATSVLGQRISDAEVDKIVASYQASETSAQKSAYDNQATGGSSNAAENPTAFADQQLRLLHPDQALATDFNTQANTFLQGVTAAQNRI